MAERDDDETETASARVRSTSSWSTIAITSFTGALVIVGVVSAVIAGLQWEALNKSNRTLEQTIISAERAWIAPKRAEYAGPIQKGRVLRVRVFFENTGKHPAFNLVHITKDAFPLIPVTVTSHDEALIDSRFSWPPNQTCDGIVPPTGDNGLTVYPSSTGEPYRNLFFLFTGGKRNTVPKQFLDMKETFMVQGCFAYRTFGKINYSAYCLYVQPLTNTKPEDWTFEFCPSGNYAKEAQTD